jgi:hypothetical protein
MQNCAGTYLDKLVLVMGRDVGYGLRNPAPAVEIGYILGVCLKQDAHFAFCRQLQHSISTVTLPNPVESTQEEN